MSLAIVGLGTALPPQGISQTHAAELAIRLGAAPVGATGATGGLRDGNARLLAHLYRKAGVETRYSVLLDRPSEPGRQSFFAPARTETDRGPTTAQRMVRYAAEAGPLAVRAAREAIERSRWSPASMTHLVTVSCSGFAAPGVDVELIEALGLDAAVERVHVGFMGCHGAINGLRVARGLAQTDPSARVLLCAVELCSLHLQYAPDRSTLVGNSLFADGAAAVVGCSAASAHSPHRPWRLCGTGSRLVPDSQEAMTWRIGDNGFEMHLAPEIPALIGRHVPAWLAGWLRQFDLVPAEVASWAVHPGGPRILDAFEQALGLPENALATSRRVLREHGNMSSPTVLFILEQFQRMPATLPCVAVAFGPGLFVEAALFR